MKLPPFHLAFPVKCLTETRQFYHHLLGCKIGRTQPGHWMDFNLYGHQIVAHQVSSEYWASRVHSHVDSHRVPVPHFGIVLEWQAYHDLVHRLQTSQIKFEIEPTVRFKGQVGEQSMMFFLDPSGNALEFKSFKSLDSLFAT